MAGFVRLLLRLLLLAVIALLSSPVGCPSL
jgi:hypothetical protein